MEFDSNPRLNFTNGTPCKLIGNMWTRDIVAKICLRLRDFKILFKDVAVESESGYLNKTTPLGCI